MPAETGRVRALGSDIGWVYIAGAYKSCDCASPDFWSKKCIAEFRARSTFMSTTKSYTSSPHLVSLVLIIEMRKGTPPRKPCS